MKISEEQISGKYSLDSCRRDMKIQQLFCARHFLPKTNLKQVILFKNPNNEGKFKKHLLFLETLQKQQYNTRKNFHSHFQWRQENKFYEWKAKDEQNIRKIGLSNDLSFINKYVPNSHFSLKNLNRIKENYLKFNENESLQIFPLQNKRKKLPSLRNVNADREKKHFWNNRLSRDLLKREQLLTDRRFLELCSILHPMEFSKDFVSSSHESYIITASIKTGYYQI